MHSDPKRAASLEEAQAIVTGAVKILASEKAPLKDALGRIIRQDITSDIDYPPSDMSAMDGYGFESSATLEATPAEPVLLRIAGVVKAGEMPSRRLDRGECVSIMTGATLPPGCDAVLKSEDAEIRDARVVLREPIPPGTFVRKKGEIARKGDRIDLRGRRITPRTAGVLAAFGQDPVLVTKMPRVGVFATGDEIVPYDTYPSPGCLRSSNAPTLAGLASRLGCDVVDVGISGDSGDDIGRHIEACRDCDVVIVSGGVSDGEYDLVPGALEKIGAEIGLREIRMSPGRRMVFGRRGNTVFFGVPGNPGAAIVSFEMVVKPGLLRMMGCADFLPTPFKARTTAGIEKERGYTKLIPGVVRQAYIEPDGWAPARCRANLTPDESTTTRGQAPRPEAGMAVEPLKSRGAGDVLHIAEADCLICIGEAKASVSANDLVDVFML